MGSSCNSHGMEVLPVVMKCTWNVVQFVAFSINSGVEFGNILKLVITVCHGMC